MCPMCVHVNCKVFNTEYFCTAVYQKLFTTFLRGLTKWHQTSFLHATGFQF